MTTIDTLLRSGPLRRNRGTSHAAFVFGLLFWAMVVAFCGLVAVKTLPTLNEYWTIERSIRKVLQDHPGSIPAIRTAFDRQKDIEYAISAISGSDLEVTQQGDRFTVSFAYDKEIALIEPVYLLIKYKGSHTN